MKLDDIDIHAIGTEIQVVGMLYADRDTVYTALLPGSDLEGLTAEALDMDLPDWERFIQQTDRLEVRALVKDEHGTVGKAIVRKSARQISQNISWSVFRRDHYRCRYCGRNTVPLTVDHLVLWEDGGPSIEANLVAACKKCNKTRGRMEYGEWLRSRYYKKISAGLPPMIQEDNERLLGTLGAIPRHPLGGARKR